MPIHMLERVVRALSRYIMNTSSARTSRRSASARAEPLWSMNAMQRALSSECVLTSRTG